MRRLSFKGIFGFLILIAALNGPQLSLAHSVGVKKTTVSGEIKSVPVHQYLAQEALAIWPGDKWGFPGLIINDIYSRLDDRCEGKYNGLSGNNDSLIIGTGEEDQAWNPFSCGVHQIENCTDDVDNVGGHNGYFEHFWDPDRPLYGGFNCGHGQIGGYYNRGLRDVLLTIPSEKTYGERYWDSSYRLAQFYWDWFIIPQYRQGEKNKAYYYLGKVAHLLTDATVPAHVHDDPHAFPYLGDDIFEELAGDWNRLGNYTGNSSLGLYKYEKLDEKMAEIIPFKWGDVHEQENPPNLFKLFWYTAQKTQYFPSNQVSGDNGNFIKVKNWGTTPETENDSFGIPGLWKPDDKINFIIGNLHNCVDSHPSDYEQKCNTPLLDALIPHAIKAVAGLYRLFWNATYCGNTVGQGAIDGLPFIDSFSQNGGLPNVGCPTNSVHLWGNVYTQDFEGETDGKGALILDGESNTVYWVHGDIWELYKSLCDVKDADCLSKSDDLKGPNSWLGVPISNEEPLPVFDSPSNVIQRFKNGYITHLPGSTPYWKAYHYDTPGTGNAFNDVPPDHWAYFHIISIYDSNLTTGCSQNPPMFCPDDFVTREQMATFIIRSIEGEPPANYCDFGIPFTDVTSDMWSCRFIKRLKELGITGGYPDGRYGPYDLVSREQMAAFLVGALEGAPSPNYCDSGALFSDVTPGMWSCGYIKRLAELGITTGYGDGRFGPYDAVTRAQMAVFLSRAFLITQVAGPWPMFGHDPQHSNRSQYLGPSIAPTLKWAIHGVVAVGDASRVILSPDGKMIYGISDYYSQIYPIIIGDLGDAIYGINIDTSSVDKYYKVGTIIEFTPALDSNGVLYFGDVAGNIYALNPDFSLKWKKSGYFPGVSSKMTAPPTIGTDGNIYFVGGEFKPLEGRFSGIIICVSPDGNKIWEYKPNDAYVDFKSPAIGFDGTIYIVVYNSDELKGSLVALNANGTFKWTYDIRGDYGNSILHLTPTIGVDGSIYVATSQYFYAINQDGTIKWKIPELLGGYYPSSLCIGPDGTIYLANMIYLFAINPSTGSIKWNRLLGIQERSNQITVDANGTLFLRMGSSLSAIDGVNGNTRWMILRYSPFESPIINSDGGIIVHQEGTRTLFYYK